MPPEIMELNTHPKIHPAVLQSGDPAAQAAASALIVAIRVQKWPQNKLQANGRMTQRTLAALQAQAAIPEVQQFLAALLQQNYRVDSREWHYFKYKYEYNDALVSPAELDQRLLAVITDRQGRIYPKTGRWVVYSPREQRLAVVGLDGQRITVYRPDLADVTALGSPVWLIQTLID